MTDFWRAFQTVAEMMRAAWVGIILIDIWCFLLQVKWTKNISSVIWICFSFFQTWIYYCIKFLLYSIKLFAYLDYTVVNVSFHVILIDDKVDRGGLFPSHALGLIHSILHWQVNVDDGWRRIRHSSSWFWFWAAKPASLVYLATALPWGFPWQTRG